MIGQTISHYKILEKLGEGGMGVVYKARDTHLDRFVAIKVLPPEKVADPERKQRFVQEAKAASALNHPNIITIYDIDQGEGIDFIAMEYVDGRTLDELIGRKGLKLSEALKVSVQMADALAAAHEAGIVHRDLKPGNVMVTGKGQVKVLDFGLAKLTEVAESGEGVTRTLESLTEEGMIVGTVSYMSPEQGEGKKVDARSDIFSFGAVLYEMVTGQRAFPGESNLAILTAILREEPKAISQFVKGVPQELEKIIKRCLRKDRQRRWQTMTDVKVGLQDLKEEMDSGSLAAAGMPQPKRRLGLIWAAVLLALVAAFAAFLWLTHSSSKTPPSPMTAIPLTSDPGFEMAPSFSPDGNQVAYVADGGKGDWGLYIKQIGSGSPFLRAKSTREEIGPLWSPDGGSIAFLRGLGPDKAAVLLIPALNGPERQLAEIHAPLDLMEELNGPFLLWLPDGKWLVTSDKGSAGEPFGLFLVSVETGEKRKLTSPPAKWFGDFYPALSPDGHTLAFTRFVSDAQSDLYLMPISSNYAPEGEPKRLTFDDQGDKMPAWTANGREIVFVHGSEHFHSLWRIGAFGPSAPEPLPFAGVGEGATSPAISRQGNRLAYMQGLFDTDIWRVDVPDYGGKAGPPKMLISSTRVDHQAKFSPDSKRIALVSYRSGNSEVWICDSDGSNPVQVTSMNWPFIGTLSGWSPDGERVAFSATEQESSAAYSVSTQGGKPIRLSEGSAPNWSGDGQWIYFSSDRSGQAQVWKISARGGTPLKVTLNGGDLPVESKDGKTLFYLKNGGLWKVSIQGGEESRVLDSIYQNCFAVGHKGIYFIPKADETGVLYIQNYSFGSGKTRRITEFPKERYVGYGFDISPDERWILFTLDSASMGSDLMLVENFR
jgi:serine/threonine protein kinase